MDPRLQTTESSEPASNNARRWRVIRQDTQALGFQAPKFQDSDRDQYLKVQDQDTEFQDQGQDTELQDRNQNQNFKVQDQDQDFKLQEPH